MRVSVVIPALNEEQLLAAAIASAWAAGAAEVVVADGGSHDRTREIAEADGGLVVTGRRGRAAQQNAGAERAAGDVLLFLHADNRLGSDAIQQVSDALSKSGAWGGVFWQQIEAPGALYRALEYGNAWRVRWRGLPYGDQGIFIRREVFRELGGFPELPLMEDLVLMRQLRRRAWPLLLPGPVYVHPRRWQRHGIVRQTLRNWLLVTAWRLGVSPERLAAHYRRHDQ